MVPQSSVLTGAPADVLLTLIELANQNECSISYTMLSAESGRCEATVVNAIRTLHEREYITIHKPYRGQRNCYRILRDRRGRALC